MIVIPFLPPEHLRSWTFVVLGGLETALLIAIVIVDPGRIDAVGALVRGLSIALTLLLVAAATLATVTVVVDLLDGAPEFKSPGPLLATGFLVWLDANLTFSLLYWELDGGGAAQRLHHPRSHPSTPTWHRPDGARRSPTTCTWG